MNTFGTALMTSGSTTSFGIQMLILVGFIALMYVLLIRPQRKKEKSINEMRNALRVGDEVVTIGGICGKIVKTKDETLILQVGADKVKFEVMRWSISSVTSKSNRPAKDVADGVAEDDEETTSRKSSPRRLKKAAKEEPKAEEKKEEVKAEAKAEAEETTEESK